MNCPFCLEGRCTTPAFCEREWRKEIPSDPLLPDIAESEPVEPPITDLTCPECGGQLEGCPICALLEEWEAGCPTCGKPAHQSGEICPVERMMSVADQHEAF